MKATSFSLLFLIFYSFSYSQQNNDLLIKKYNDEIIRLEEQLTRIKQKRDSLLLLNARIKNDSILESGIKTVVNLSGAKIQNEPNITGTILKELNVGDTVLIHNRYNDKYYQVSNDSIMGFVNVAYIKRTNELKVFEKKKENSSINPISNAAKLFHNPKDEERIKQKKIWIGMRSKQTIRSIGKPSKINASNGSWGKHEQWIYESKGLYLYFENGILKSYQK